MPSGSGECSMGSNTIANALQLLDNSPRNLMSSLQHRRVRSNDVAMEEILRDRKAAIESGKLKGRRLFVASECETEMGLGEREEMCSGCFDLVQESEVSSYGSRDENGIPGGCCCCSCSGSSLSDEKVERERELVGGEKVGVNVEVKRDECGVGNGGTGRWMLLMGLFSIGLMVFTLGIIYSRCNGGYGDEDEVMLVPT